ncbi:MAG: response regulator [Flavobacteriales bacterium]|nr:response regulator [Flavobacteriales bacterium]
MRTINEILLVEDNETTSFLNVRLLVKMEISDKITVRNNGEKGINYLIDLKKNGDNYLGVIFLDIKMPVMDGFYFLRELPILEPLPANHPPIVM